MLTVWEFNAYRKSLIRRKNSRFGRIFSLLVGVGLQKTAVVQRLSVTNLQKTASNHAFPCKIRCLQGIRLIRVAALGMVRDRASCLINPSSLPKGHRV
jgi:hypothetical protein